VSVLAVGARRAVPLVTTRGDESHERTARACGPV